MTQKQSTKPLPDPIEEAPNVTDQVKSHIQEAYEKYSKQYENIHDKVEDVSQTIIKTTKKKPVFALAMAVGLGVLIGKIFK